MASAVEANLFAFFQQLNTWPRVAVHDEARWLWTLSDVPFPLFNSVLRSQMDEGGGEAGIDERIRACEERRVPMLWWTGPSSTPADLGERLLRRGFLLEPAYGMAADLGAAAGGADHPSLAVEPVHDAATLATWSRVLCDAFGAPQAFGDAFTELASAIGLGPASPFRHFLGRVNGEAAATVSVFFGAGVAGIYDVATLPAWRRRGLGTAVTRAAMAEAIGRGSRTAILHSSRAGAGVYRSLGFTEVCPIGQYVWVPEHLR